jgi:hypothetical protein
MKTLLMMVATALTVQARQIEVTHENIVVVKLKVVGGKPAVETVYLDGQGPYRFLVDTGAEPNVVDAKLARKLGIEASFATKMLTPAGMTAAVAARGRVSLGTAEATDQVFLVTRLDGLRAASPDIRGILGQSFLSQFDYIIDFKKRELVFGRAVTSRPPVPIRRIRNLIAISTNEGDLVLDSGIGTLLLFRAPAGRGRTVEIRASSGLTSLVSLDSVPELNIGGQIYHPGTAAFEPREGQVGNGLLPASLFRAVFVCNSAGYIVIDP